MRLFELIHHLERFDPDLPLRFENGDKPLGLESWRGDYSELTIDWAPERAAADRTVGMILEEAKGAIGKTFIGYKGGDFVMNKYTEVWADRYGCYEKRFPSYLVEKDGYVEIISFVDDAPW